jgi:hypothetical protein
MSDPESSRRWIGSVVGFGREANLIIEKATPNGQLFGGSSRETCRQRTWTLEFARFES